MTGYCPNCDKECTLEIIRETEEISIRGEGIEVDVEYMKCTECGEEYEDLNSEVKPVEAAYVEYRKRHNMVTPEEIVELRQRFGLTQHDLSAILGWGGATVSRYENGALQDDAHDNMLRLALDPVNLLKLVNNHSVSFGAVKKDKIIGNIQSEISNTRTSMCGQLYLNGNNPDIFSGYVKANPDKIKNAILFFCEKGMLKTPINKNMFYADFKHFKDHGVSITGAKYAHIPYGPCVDKYEHLLAEMIETDNNLQYEEVVFDKEKNIVGDKYVSLIPGDLSLFSPLEVKTMKYVQEFFKDFTTGALSDFSHREEGYKATSDGELISFEYARSLQI